MKLQIGNSPYFEVRKEYYPLAGSPGLSVLYLSDLHFDKHSPGMNVKIIDRVEELDPDIILLGGDYVDFEKDLIHLDSLLSALSNRKNIFAIAGNHDYKFNVDTIKKTMVLHNVAWIEKKSVTFTVNNIVVQIDGTKPSTAKSTADFCILCLHHPIDISRYKDKYNLVFAGHLHGCQFVFWQHNKALYPGKFIFKWNILEKKLDGCHYFISKGMGNTLPVRFNCAKEMIFVQAGNKDIVT